LANADQIYVLENGRLIERGDWTTLVVKDGRFRD
jgi:ABC-type transport system involved in Fe-S cluster assembly fused permease/ATPase subunit